MCVCKISYIHTVQGDRVACRVRTSCSKLVSTEHFCSQHRVSSIRSFPKNNKTESGLGYGKFAGLRITRAFYHDFIWATYFCSSDLNYVFPFDLTKIREISTLKWEAGLLVPQNRVITDFISKSHDCKDSAQ
mgnify:CR=1 FL=1